MQLFTLDALAHNFGAISYVELLARVSEDLGIVFGVCLKSQV